MMKAILASAALAATVSAAEAASVYDVTFSATNFEDSLTATPASGSVSGSFVFEDGNMDGIIEIAEITSFDFMASGFAAAELNISFDETTGSVQAEYNAGLGGTVDGLLVSGLSFSLGDIFFDVFADLGDAFYYDDSDFDPDLYTIDYTFTATLRQDPPPPPPNGEVPLPAALPLLAAGLAGFGLFRRRRSG